MTNMHDQQDRTGLEIAVIGKAGRFPGAADIEAFWNNLRDGIESISFLTEDEVRAAGEDPELLSHPQYVRAYGVLADADLFDAAFFGYSPRDAEIMDPQHRIFLECAWEALENAGYDPSRAPGLIGVYGGASINTYLLGLLSRPELVARIGGAQAAIANSNDFLCTRVSYKLNLQGPSVVVQSACSTSLVAVHLACRGLLSGECDMALAGGVSIRFPQKVGYLHQEGGVLSPDGHCRAFDASARGAVGGNGVGVVVLKPLENALADGDSICAVILGTAINNDGSAKAGYTAPRVDGQAGAIRAAQLTADVPPETISYVETHGTGTKMGDPIEIAALTKAFRAGTDKKGFCAIGSVKTNVGHLDAAAGVTGLIKTVLALERRSLPPSLHFERPNPEIDFAESPFYVNARSTEWPAGPTPRRAAVSSFGIGGTNAHAILEEAPRELSTGPGRPWQLVVLSARTESALEEATSRLADHLDRHPELGLADVAYTSQVGRAQFPVRRTLVCRDRNDAVTALRTRDPKRLDTAHQSLPDPPVAFLFSGLGDQYVGMGRGLYRDEPVFREEVDRCARLLAPILGADLLDILYPGGCAETEDETSFVAPGPDLRRMVRPAPGMEDEATRRLDRTAFAQPALFVLEYALARLWISWGVRPTALIGYSLGEYVAACLAGVLPLEDALTLVARRAQIIDALPAGGVLAVALPESRILDLLGDELSLTAVNGTSLCVVGGSLPALAGLERRLAEEGVSCRRLKVSHPLHSRLLVPAVEEFRTLVQTFSLQPPIIPYISNVTGTWIDSSEATDSEYWLAHLCETVRFAQGVAEIWKEPGRILLEVGPGRSLGQLSLQQLDHDTGLVLPSLRASYERQSDQALLLKTLGQLWMAGVPVDWSAFHAHERRRRVPLPTYPFERRRHWIEAGGEPRPQLAAAGAAPPRPAPRADASAPRPEIEEKLGEIWSELLGVPQVARDDNFFRLGGSSLTALDLGSRVDAAFGVRLPPEFLLEAATIAGMGDLIAAALAVSGAPPPPSSCLVQIQRGNGRRPLFLVHPVGGHVYFYRQLAEALGDDQPVYGLRASGLEPGEEVHGSIEQMSAHYVEAICAIDPSGPYFLGGSSMGGMIAYEMAQQIRSRGQRVSVLALVDTPGPDQMPARPADQAELFHLLYSGWLPISLDELRRRNDEERISYLLAAAQTTDVLPQDFDEKKARLHLEVVAALWATMFDYQPRTYPGSILFFRARDRGQVAFIRPEQPWIDLAEQGVEVHVVPGDHTTMHNPPHVEVLAARLRAALDRAGGGH